MSSNYDFELLVPAKNEADNLSDLLERIHVALKTKKISYRVIVIDDYSTDNTAEVLKNLTRKYPVVRVAKTGKPGKAFALLEGMAQTTAPIVGMIDADLEYPPEVLPEMYNQAKELGVSVANRISSHKSALRKIASKTNRFIFGNLLLHLNCDVQSGLKVFHREVIEHLNVKHVQAWSIDIPLLHTARELGYEVGTVDIEFTPRTIGISKCKAELTKAVKEITVGAVKVKLSRKRVYPIKPESDNSSLGAGVVIHKRRYVTHSQLPTHLSAIHTLHGWQKAFLLLVLLALVGGVVKSPKDTAIILVGILTFIYFIDVLFNMFLIFKSLHFPPELSFSDQEVDTLKNSELPIYTILCPLYKEAAVLPHFVENIEKLNWPKSKLDVLLLLEADDTQTQNAAKSLNLPNYIRTLVVPHSQPKTKPKACNYGLAHAKGEYVVIYDAEDRPDPDQLKKAFLGFKKSRESVVCLQGKLNYYNPNQNLLTRLFTAEYSLWFDVMLPGMQSINTSIPLGGTSNHFKVEILRKLHGWDAFNVTEDCDLGARLFQAGYTTAIIDSTTLEEANSKLGNWIRQRSRWIKGYIQTYLVHNRHPLRFIRKHGIHAFIFQLTVGGKIAFMIINPFLWLMTIAYFVLYQFVGPAIESLYPSFVFYMAIISLVLGNFLFLYYYMIGTAKRGHWSLVKYIFFIPFYWLAVSVAAMKAFKQLIVKPHYWEKTVHGLHLSPAQQALSEQQNPNEATETQGSPISESNTQAAISKASPRPNQSFKLDTTFSRPISTSAMLVAATLIASLLNFLYIAYLGRVLNFVEFGLIGLIGTFLSISQVPLTAFSKSVTYRTAFLLGKHQYPAVDFWKKIRGDSAPLALIFTGLWLMAIPLLMNFFKTPDALPFLVFTPIWFIGITAAADSGFLTGSHKFFVTSLMVVVEAFTKLSAAIILVNTNNANIVYIAIPIAAATSFFIGWIAAKKLKSIQTTVSTSEMSFPVKFFTSSVLSKISIVAFLNIDVLLAKHYLSSEAAGEYALLSVIGNMVFFMGNLFTQLIVPLVSKNEGKNTSSRSVMISVIALTVIATVLGISVFGIFGFLTVPILFGAKAIAIIDYLPLYTFAMSCVVVGSAIVSFHQVKGRHSFSLAGTATALILIFAIVRNHSSVGDINQSVSLMGIFYLLLVLLLHHVQSKIEWFIRNTVDLFSIFSNRIDTTTAYKKILIFNWRDTKHVWAGGAEVYIHELAKRWVKDGYSVTLFCGNDGNCSRNDIVDGVEIVRRGGFYTVYLWAFLYYITKFRNKYSLIVDATNGAPFFTPLYANVPITLIIYHVHQEVFQKHLSLPLAIIAQFIERNIMPKLYKNKPIITVSESSKQDIMNLGQFSESQISVVHPGTDKPKSLKPKTDYPSFIYFGRLKPYKQVDIAIKAFAKIVKIYPSSRLTIAGDGESKQELEKLAAELHVGDKVTFTGKVSEATKWELLSKSWIAIQPSSAEGWGITVIEANAAGTPVIASRISGLKDSVIDKETGILVGVGSVEELYAAMTVLVKNNKSLMQLSKNAKAWSESFSWDDAATKFIRISSVKTNQSAGKYYLLSSSS